VRTGWHLATPVLSESVRVLDFSDWRSVMESALSASVTGVKSMLPAADAAAPAHGEDGGDEHHEQ
jgi:hypothetical protein